MPDDTKQRRLKRREPPPPPSSDDEDSSVDSKGNIRDLIDYDYEETSEEPAKRHRASAIAAKRKIRKIMKVTPDSEQKGPHLEVMETSDDDIVKPKRRVFIESNRNVLIPERKSKAEEMEMDTDSSEEDVKRSKKMKKREKKEKKKDKKKKHREESSEEEEEEEEEYD
jgi:hypothetical protein